VDSAQGLDTNPGTSSRPLKTLTRAAQIALSNYRSGQTTRVVIHPGMYRESILMDNKIPNRTGAISFEAGSPGEVIVSGADVWAGWQPDPSMAGQYIHSWPYHWGPCTLPPNWPPLADIVRRREMIFVDGTALTQTLSRDNLPEGSFFIDEGAGLTVMRPPAGTDISAATIEVSTRPRLFDSHGIAHLTIRGLTFVGANSCISVGAVEIWAGSDEIIEDSTVRWNNWDGIKLFSSANSTLRGVVSSHNGSSGLIAHELTNMTFEDVEMSYNNWRGAQGKFFYFENGGAKFMRVHNSTFKHFRAVGNETMGLWFDTDNANILIDASYLCRNQINGLMLEANQGPITVTNSKICNNGREGILAYATQNVTLTGNLIAANAGAQIFVDERKPFRSDHDWETSSNYTISSSHWTIMGNTIVGFDNRQGLIARFPPPAQSPTLFLETLHSDSNTWFHSVNNSSVFTLDPGGPGHATNKTDLGGWRSVTGQDRNSKFAQPSFDPMAACAAP
jgi:hypothetical protein